MDKFLDLVTDPYARKARATPALLTVLPLVVPLICQFGSHNPVLTGILGLFGTCGAIYAAASIARGRGKLLEERLVKEWGGLPTTILLRHRDDFFDRVTKNRYHLDALVRLGIQMPTEAEELADPIAADDVYRSVGRRLRELTRGDKKLLLAENIAYGFHRNMLAMKGVGIFFCFVGIIYGLVLAGALKLDPLSFDLHGLLPPGLSGGLTLLVSLALLAAWFGYFNKAQVRAMGNVYAERLFEKLASLPKLRGRPSATAKTATGASSPSTSATP